jgi:hypothetical protein
MRKPSIKTPHLAVFVVLLLSCGMTYYHLGLYLPHVIQWRIATGLGGGYSFGDDFYPIWLTSREALLQHRNPYAPDMTRDIQVGIFGRPLNPRRPGDPLVNYRAFAYPAYVDLLFWPLSLVPFPALRVGLAILLAILTIISLPLWLRFLRLRASPLFLALLLMLTLSSYAVLEGLFAGQVGLVVGFLLAASFAAMVDDRLFLAGTFLSFTFIKPQMSAIVAVYLILWSVSDWRKRRHFVYGLSAWSVLLASASLLVWPHWITEWRRILSGYGGYSQPPLITYSLGPSLGPKLGPFLTVTLLAAALILMWKMRKLPVSSPWFALTISLLLALTAITILPGQAVHDHVMLLPGILLIALTWRRWFSSSRTLRIIVAAGALALFWQWITGPFLLVLRYFLPPARFFTNPVLLLPFHAAASLPLAVSATLGYMMAKALREGRFEEQSLASRPTNPVS